MSALPRPQICPTCGETCQPDDLKCDECGHDLPSFERFKGRVSAIFWKRAVGGICRIALGGVAIGDGILWYRLIGFEPEYPMLTADILMAVCFGIWCVWAGVARLGKTVVDARRHRKWRERIQALSQGVRCE